MGRDYRADWSLDKVEKEFGKKKTQIIDGEAVDVIIRAPKKRQQQQHPITEMDDLKVAQKSFVVQTGDKNVALGNGIAMGSGIISNNNQIVLGRYNEPNTTDILQIGGGTSGNRKTMFSINKNGEVVEQGRGMVVEETDGVVHEVVCTYGEEIKKIYTRDDTDGERQSNNNTYSY